ncbi:MAG: helix-turn-helix domain-containing protein [Desulfatitalea sp.]|nr:helix-turn-helix domain-containing protein [Desulfatitalea sp.]MBI5897374.1 helix-turn-helix domain-containing protein [Desulfobacterales bacterium]
MYLVEDKWFTVDEICKYLNVSNETIYKWIDQIGLPAHKVGRRWMFKREQVDRWVQSGDAAFEEKKSSVDAAAME